MPGIDDSKTPISRGALERVLARAVELQAAGGDARDDAMSEGQLIEIGKEVGLSADNVRQALAEERARGEPTVEPAGLLATFIGASRVSAQRTVPGAPDAVLASLDRLMQNEEWLRIKRQQRDRMVWEPRNDFLGGLRQAFAGRKHLLHKASDVAGTVAGVDASRSVVALSADLSSSQRSLIGQATAGVVIGAAASGALAVMGFMMLVAVLPAAALGLGSLYGARRAMERNLERTQDALEAVLDRLERRSTEVKPPSLLQMIDSALPRLR
jgi:hypothetical protein